MNSTFHYVKESRMVERVSIGCLEVAEELYRFIEDEALPGSLVDSAAFWTAAEAIITDLSGRRLELLATRATLQTQLDVFHQSNPGPVRDVERYEAMLREIGYLVHAPADFSITTAGVDTEIAEQAGPQLVVPLLNARFAVNAANARWGSLYDALYGTDVIDRTRRAGPRHAVQRRSRAPRSSPAVGPSSTTTSRSPAARTRMSLATRDRRWRPSWRDLADGPARALADPAQFVGYRGDGRRPTAIVLVHHGLHVEIQLDRGDPIGATDRAGVKDSCSSLRSPRSWISRTRSPPSTRPTRCSAIATGCG